MKRTLGYFAMRVDAPHLRLVVNKDRPAQKTDQGRKKTTSEPWSGTEVSLVYKENQASSQNAIGSVSEAQVLLRTIINRKQ
ncbi:MAG: hypothetical protein KKC37_03700, partial [Proteobacteria bacterium]|nr:hypothetical protein [Pseudomonadota bacterium]